MAALLHLAASQVEALEAELDGRIAEDSVLCPHAPNHVLEGKLRELEEVNTNLARRISVEGIIHKEDCLLREARGFLGEWEEGG